MATKKKSAKGPAAEPLMESAHRIWLAGLGALATAEEEGGKLFRQLVERGESFRGPVKEPIRSARGKVQETVDEVRSRAGRTVERLESAVDDRVGSVLEKIGVPSRAEIADLTRRVERLTRAIESAGVAVPAKKAARRKKTTGSSAAARRKTAKRATKKTTSRSAS